MKKLLICLLILSLAIAPAAMAQSYVPLDLNSDQRYAASLFLSNFTEVGCESLGTDSPDMDLVDFAHDHLWFNSNKSYEFGDYFDGYNCRVSDDKIQGILNSYLYDPHRVDLTETRFEYKGGYYYHDETGGWTSMGYAAVTSMCPLGDDFYFVSFLVFGAGEDWTNDDIRLSVAQSAKKYGGPCAGGSAVVHAADISRRGAYTLCSYTRMLLQAGN